MEPNGQFCTTHCSVVVSAGHGDLRHAAEALEKLCGAYWYPLYVYIRRQGNSPERTARNTVTGASSTTRVPLGSGPHIRIRHTNRI